MVVFRFTGFYTNFSEKIPKDAITNSLPRVLSGNFPTIAHFTSRLNENIRRNGSGKFWKHSLKNHGHWLFSSVLLWFPQDFNFNFFKGFLSQLLLSILESFFKEISFFTVCPRSFCVNFSDPYLYILQRILSKAPSMFLIGRRMGAFRPSHVHQIMIHEKFY